MSDEARSALNQLLTSLDQLGARGVRLSTNASGRYLGDAHYRPLPDHLDRRGATVFVHPIASACCTNVVPGIPDTVIEYGAETAHTIASLISSEGCGRVTRSPSALLACRRGAVVDHPRLTLLARQKGHEAPDDFVFSQIARLHFDTAQAGNRINLDAFRSLVPLDHLHFGSDYPFIGIADQLPGLRAAGLSAQQVRLVLSSINGRLQAKRTCTNDIGARPRDPRRSLSVAQT